MNVLANRPLLTQGTNRWAAPASARPTLRDPVREVTFWRWRAGLGGGSRPSAAQHRSLQGRLLSGGLADLGEPSFLPYRVFVSSRKLRRSRVALLCLPSAGAAGVVLARA